MVENDAVNVTAYVRIYKDPTGVLWHNFNGYCLRQLSRHNQLTVL